MKQLTDTDKETRVKVIIRRGEERGHAYIGGTQKKKTIQKKGLHGEGRDDDIHERGRGKGKKSKSLND